VLLPLTADVKELPDVEITGPSDISTTTDKEGLLNNELAIPPIADSLTSAIPNVDSDKPLSPKLHSNAVFAEMSNRIDFKVHARFDSLLHRPISFVASAIRRHPLSEWNSLSVSAGFEYRTGKTKMSSGLKTLYEESPQYFDRQYINSAYVNYCISDVVLIGKKAKVRFTFEPQQCITYSDSLSEVDTDYLFKASFNTNIYLSAKHNFEAEAGLLYQTPYLLLSDKISNLEGEKLFSLFKAFSLGITDKRLMPGIQFVKRLNLDKRNTILFYQQSDFVLYDNYLLKGELPYQVLSTNGMISFKPVNAHIKLSNNALSFNNKPIMLSLDAGVSYFIDKPVYYPSVLYTVLPEAFKERVLLNSILLKVQYGKGKSLLTQSLEVSKGWIKSKADIELPYEPLVKLETDYQYMNGDFKLNAWLSQQYFTKDENCEQLRESIDLGTKLDYKVLRNLVIYAKAENLPDKGKIVFRTIPTDPLTVVMGFLWSF
jgi:hypothetical protein